MAENYIVTEEPHASRKKAPHEAMKKFDFSRDIIETALKVWDEVGSKLEKKRKLLFFFCFYVAHVRQGIVQDHEYIAEKIGLNPSEAVRSFTVFSETQTGFKMPLVHFSVPDFLDLYLTRLGMDQDRAEIFEVYQKLLDSPETETKRTLFEATKPQNVAAAIIYYYKWELCSRLTSEEYQLMYKKKETINNFKSMIADILCAV